MKLKCSMLFGLILVALILPAICYAEKDDAKKEAFLEHKALIDDSITSHSNEIKSLKVQADRGISLMMTYVKLAGEGAKGKDFERNRQKNMDELKDTNNKIKEHQMAIKDLKMKRSELKMKVIDNYGGVPEWWGPEEKDPQGSNLGE